MASRSEAPAARVLLAKPGMDGHSRGIRVVMRALQDAGCEVIYLGIRRPAELIARVALDEDVDVVGLSLLSGAHLSLTADVLRALEGVGLGGVPVIVGGVIPEEDHGLLEDMGVAAIFTPGAPLATIRETVLGLRRAPPGARAARPGAQPT